MQKVERNTVGYYRALMGLLKVIGVKTRGYIVKDSPIGKYIVLTGGDEVVASLTEAEMNQTDIEALGLADERMVIMKYEDKVNMVLDPVEYVDYYNLLMLNKYSYYKKITNEELVNFKREAETVGFVKNAEFSAFFKSQIETNIVYVYDKKPSTNSLALAKQFELKHKHVIQKLLEIPMNRPSLFNDLHWNPYKYKTGKDNAIVNALYLEVSEEMYVQFIQRMGTSHSQQMRVLRTKKVDEYLQGFQNLRDDLYRSGLSKAEVKDLVDERTVETKRLMNIINTYVTEYNEKYGDSRTPLNFPTINRIVFNLVNLSVGINSTKFKVNRRDKNGDIQQKLLDVERGLIKIFNINFTISPRKFIRAIFSILNLEEIFKSDKEKDELIIAKLEEYNSSHLYIKLDDIVEE